MSRWQTAGVRATLGGLLLALAAGGCEGPATGGLPGVETLAARGALSPGVDRAALRRGRAYLVTECAACHRLYKPHELPPRRWARLAVDMGGRAGLGAGQIRDLALYLEAAAGPAGDAHLSSGLVR